MPTTEVEFTALAERHRRELHVHCYRMLGSFEEAEDVVQEALLRAWRGRETLRRIEWTRAWLYRIATNACLDALRRQDRRVPAANSALQRARATLRQHLPPGRREDWAAPEVGPAERALLARFIDAHERGDTEAALALFRDDIRITMPPFPYLYEGRQAVAELMARAGDRAATGEWRLAATAANRQPAAASYLRAPGEGAFRAFKLDVLRVVDGAIAEITTFGHALFPAFGLPADL